MTKKQIRAWIQGVCKNRNSKSRALVMTLAVMVVFVTTYMLILPAITLDKDAAQKQHVTDYTIPLFCHINMRQKCR